MSGWLLVRGLLPFLDFEANKFTMFPAMYCSPEVRLFVNLLASNSSRVSVPLPSSSMSSKRRAACSSVKPRSPEACITSLLVNLPSPSRSITSKSAAKASPLEAPSEL